MKHNYRKFYQILVVSIVTTILALPAYAEAASDFSVGDSNRREASELTVSDCKNRAIYGARHQIAEAEDNERSEGIRLTGDDNALIIEWLNYEANCCPEGFSFTMEVDEEGIDTKNGGIMNIYVSDEDGMCDCLCPYDLKGVFTDIKEGLYTLRFHRNGRFIHSLMVYVGEWLSYDFMFPTTEEQQEKRFYSSETENSGCVKDNYRSASRSEQQSSQYAWTLKFENKTLSVQWEYVVGNCNTPGFDSWIIKENGNTLNFYIEEKDIPGWNFALCFCPFDVDTSYTDLTPGDYILRFHRWNGVYETRVYLTEGYEAKFTANDFAAIRAVEDCVSPIRMLPEKMLRFESHGDFVVELMDAEGIVLYRLHGNDSEELSISNLPSGIYVAVLKTADGENHSYRFIR